MTTEVKYLPEVYEYPRDSFKTHLEDEDNSRILFSGKFGMGKTRFLEDFFKSETQEKVLGAKKYRIFKLYPVNYSIASNEDIYKYIKYDIIISMIVNGITVEDSDFTFLDTLPGFLRTNLDKLLATLVSMIPKVGKDIFQSYQNFDKLRSEFKEHKKKVGSSESTQLTNYLELIEKKEGSIYESNIIERLISNILGRLSEQTNQQNILLIDDLDRIDPEHIFRILNVFAAQIDVKSNLSNRLGFDKVVIVCDEKNIRNVFAAKYGQETDFSGYIDKFYSKQIFRFDNREILKKISDDAFTNLRYTFCDLQTEKVFSNNVFRNRSLVNDLLYTLIDRGFINLKSLIKRKMFALQIDHDKNILLSRKSPVQYLYHPVLLHFEILKSFVGDYASLFEIINGMKAESLLVDNLDYACNELLYYVTCDLHLFNELKKEIEFNLNGEKIFFRLDDSGQYLSKTTVSNDPCVNGNNGSKYKFNNADFKFLVLELLNKLMIAHKE